MKLLPVFTPADRVRYTPDQLRAINRHIIGFGALALFTGMVHAYIEWFTDIGPYERLPLGIPMLVYLAGVMIRYSSRSDYRMSRADIERGLRIVSVSAAAFCMFTFALITTLASIVPVIDVVIADPDLSRWTPTLYAFSGLASSVMLFILTWSLMPPDRSAVE